MLSFTDAVISLVLSSATDHDSMGTLCQWAVLVHVGCIRAEGICIDSVQEDNVQEVRRQRK